MGRPLRVLMIEDTELDAALVLRELRRGGFDVYSRRVDTAEDMEAALATETWDVILSDYSMPRFSAPSALEVVRKAMLDIPFIIVSGTVNEDVAVDALHAGAHDFMAKGKLRRLVPAIDREMREALVRRDQAKLQDQLLISDRMASMGTLAAGVAHEINNPLACVMANLELAAKEIAERVDTLGVTEQFSEVFEELHDAREASERIRNIVRDLKIFSRSEEERSGPVDVEHVLESTVRMAWNEIRHRARVVRQFGTPPFAQASESRLGQVFLNLIINAAQAITEGNATKNEIRITTAQRPDGSIAITIGDTGPGMPPEILSRLFTPFFTTKPVGVGTGLGLSICHRIITGFGGSIRVESEVGRGTDFFITLPIARDGAASVRPPIVNEPSVKTHGRVLVVDDDPMIAKAIQRVLAVDHEVIVVRSGAQALARVGSGERFDVIVCDLMMPHMTGMELHGEILGVAPDLAERMVFLTGGAFTVRARAFLDEVLNPRLEKPFTGSQLRALIDARMRQESDARP